MDNQQNNNQPQGGENGNQGNNGKFPKNQLFIVLIAAFITFAIAGFMRGYMTDKSQKEITYDEFVSEVEHGDVKAVTIKNSQIDIEYKEDSEKFNPILKTYTVRWNGTTNWQTACLRAVWKSAGSARTAWP